MSQFPFPASPQQPGWAAGGAPAPAPFAPPQHQPFAPPYAPAQPMPYAPAPQYGMPGFGQPAENIPAGDLRAFMSQPKTGRPQAVSWKGAPDGATLAGVVAEDVTDRDIVPDTDPQTRQVKRWRDGSPKYAMVLTLTTAQGPMSLYCRGDLWEKLSDAMTRAGRDGAPKAGDQVTVTLTERRASQGQMSPKNAFAVQYVTAAGSVSGNATPTNPAPVAQQPLPQAPTPAPAMPPAGAAWAAPQAAAPAPASAPAPAAPAPQAPAQTFPGANALVAGMSPEQQALLARLNGQAG